MLDGRSRRDLDVEFGGLVALAFRSAAMRPCRELDGRPYDLVALIVAVNCVTGFRDAMKANGRRR